MPPLPGFFGADFIYLLLKSRPEMAQWLKIPTALREDPASIPWWLIIAYNFSPELPGVLFVFSRYQACYIHIRVGTHTCMYK